MRVLNVILYCNGRAPEEGDHWKDELPALEGTEVIRDFHLVAKQGLKRAYHCLMERNEQLPRVKNWIDAYNVGKPDADKIWYWSGKTVEEAYTKLWQDENNFAHAVAERVLRYPVTVEGEFGPETRLVTVHEVIVGYGEEIIPSVLKQHGVPHRFLGV